MSHYLMAATIVFAMYRIFSVGSLTVAVGLGIIISCPVWSWVLHLVLIVSDKASKILKSLSAKEDTRLIFSCVITVFK
jgi:hypothetical protein